MFMGSLPITAKFCMREWTNGVLYTKPNFTLIGNTVATTGRKTANWTSFAITEGLCAYTPNFIWIDVGPIMSHMMDKNLHIYSICNLLSFYGGATYMRSYWTRVHNYKHPPSNDIKIVSIIQLLNGEVLFTYKTQKQTSNFFTSTAACEVLAQPNLAGDKGDPYHFSALKRFKIRSTVSPLGALITWGKAPLTSNPHNSNKNQLKPHVICIELNRKFGEIWTTAFRDTRADRQTDRHAYTTIAILCISTGAT